MKPLQVGFCLLAMACAVPSVRAQVDREVTDREESGKESKEIVIKGMLEEGKVSVNHDVEFKKGDAYQIDMVSKDFDTYLVLNDADGKKVGEDDDDGEDLNSRLVYTANEGGKFQIVATSFSKQGKGNYVITVKQVPAPKPLVAMELKLEDGKVTKVGKIEATSPKVKRVPVQAFKIKLEQGKSYQIDVMSKAIDSLLAVRMPGQEMFLAGDDDGGEGYNSRLVFTPQKTAEYELLAGSLGGRPGEFTISVMEKTDN